MKQETEPNSEADQRRDEIILRMIATPPKPKPSPKKAKGDKPDK